MSKDAEIAMRNQKISGLNDMLSEALQHTKHPATDRGVKTIRQKIQKLEDEIDERKSVLAPRLRELMSGSGGGGGNNSLVEGPEVLKAKKDSLEKMLAEIQGRVQEQIEALDKMENFNAQVASKEEELAAPLDRMTNDRAPDWTVPRSSDSPKRESFFWTRPFWPPAPATRSASTWPLFSAACLGLAWSCWA